MRLWLIIIVTDSKLSIVPLLGFVWNRWYAVDTFNVAFTLKSLSKEKERWNLQTDMTHFFSWQSCHILSVTLWLAVVVAESVVRRLRVHTCSAQAVLRIYRQVLTQVSLPLMFFLSPEVVTVFCYYEHFKKMWWPVKTETSTKLFQRVTSGAASI